MMIKQPARQIHLDFHTSEFISGVGKDFSRENFQKALKLGNVNSINVFAKCHHSWCYFPTKIGRMHPSLEFDLLGEMIEAAHDIGVRAPVYITVGWSSNDAEAHPEWVVKNKDGSMFITRGDLNGKPHESRPPFSWKHLCPSGGYDQHIYDLTREICEKYDVDGLWYDINFKPYSGCWCESCIKGMKENGYDPSVTDDALMYHRLKWQKFMTECTKILHEKHKDATIFFNGGGAEPYMPEWHAWQTHYEMEDLPTTWGGYDKMPPRAKFFSQYGKDYLGMTGKFHTAWGEFGGFKSSDAMKYECAAMLSYGARCCIGDQLHPSGAMDLETYRLIGKAYEYVEKIEQWCFDVESTAKLGIIYSKVHASDEGLVKMLLETQTDFDVVHVDRSFDRFDCLILPDSVLLDDELAVKLNSYIKSGGSLLLTGQSGLDKSAQRFMIDVGANYQGISLYECDYLHVSEKLSENMVTSPLLCYNPAYKVHVKDAEILAAIKEPYFNRTYAHYCSHQNTPNKLENAEYPAAIKKGNIVYLSHPICKMYYTYGCLFHRQYFINALRLIYPNAILKVKMQSSGRVNLLKQPAENRYILHLLYATPIQRGITLVIEDIPTIYNVPVEITIPEKIKRAYLAPQNADIVFKQENGVLTLNIPEVNCHQILVLDY